MRTGWIYSGLCSPEYIQDTPYLGYILRLIIRPTPAGFALWPTLTLRRCQAITIHQQPYSILPPSCCRSDPGGVLRHSVPVLAQQAPYLVLSPVKIANAIFTAPRGGGAAPPVLVLSPVQIVTRFAQPPEGAVFPEHCACTTRCFYPLIPAFSSTVSAPMSCVHRRIRGFILTPET